MVTRCREPGDRHALENPWAVVSGFGSGVLVAFFVNNVCHGTAMEVSSRREGDVDIVTHHYQPRIRVWLPWPRLLRAIPRALKQDFFFLLLRHSLSTVNNPTSLSLHFCFWLSHSSFSFPLSGALTAHLYIN